MGTAVVVMAATVRRRPRAVVRASTESCTELLEAELLGPAGQVDPARETELGVRIGEMGLDGPFADEQTSRDLLGRQSLGREPGDVPFAFRERGRAGDRSAGAAAFGTERFKSFERRLLTRSGAARLEDLGGARELPDRTVTIVRGERAAESVARPCLEELPLRRVEHAHAIAELLQCRRAIAVCEFDDTRGVRVNRLQRRRRR